MNSKSAEKLNGIIFNHNESLIDYVNKLYRNNQVDINNLSCKIDLINKINDEFSNVKTNIILELNLQNNDNELKRKRIIQD